MKKLKTIILFVPMLIYNIAFAMTLVFAAQQEWVEETWKNKKQ